MLVHVQYSICAQCICICICAQCSGGIEWGPWRCLSLSDSRWFHKEAAAGKSFSLSRLFGYSDVFGRVHDYAKVTRKIQRMPGTATITLVDVQCTLGCNSKYIGSNARFKSNSGEWWWTPPWSWAQQTNLTSQQRRMPKICLKSVSTENLSQIGLHQDWKAKVSSAEPALSFWHL